jgi:hypothetical protein
VTIAKNPTMLFWLDNNQNHGTAINESWGRRCRLFSLGAGNYTEVDVREASRAFTGWTRPAAAPACGRFPWKFEYRAEDHDDGEKTFLGHKGSLSSEDIIIIVKQPACARLCRHLRFFVADEPQVLPGRSRAARSGGGRGADEGVQDRTARSPVLKACSPRTSSRGTLSAPEVAGRSGRRHTAPGRRP